MGRPGREVSELDTTQAAHAAYLGHKGDQRPLVTPTEVTAQPLTAAASRGTGPGHGTESAHGQTRGDRGDRPGVRDAGLAAAAAGGNAVDAAIAAMVAAMTTEPGIVSAAGGAFVSVWPAGGDPGGDRRQRRDARAWAWTRERFGAGLREVHTSYGGGLTLYAGHGSVATPGAFAALGVAHDRHGAAPWTRGARAERRRGPRPAIAIGGAAASYLAITGESVFGWDEHTRPLVTRRRRQRSSRPGRWSTNPDLADTLEQIGVEGARSLYTGDLAARIAADSDARGGLVTAADLAAYRAVVRTPLRLALGEWDLATQPATLGRWARCSP